MHSTTGTKSGSCQSSVGDLRAPSLENTLFKSQGKLGKWESNPDNLFFQSPHSVGFCVCPPRVTPPLFQKRDLLPTGSKSTQHRITCELMLLFPLS